MTESQTPPPASGSDPAPGSDQPGSDQNGLLAPGEAFRWARDAMAARHWEQAARRWAILRAVYPDHAPVWVQAGIALRESGRHEEATALLCEARHRFPNHPGGWVQGAEVARAAGDVNEAGRLLAAAREQFSGDPAVWLRSAELAQEIGDDDAALGCNRHVRDTFPDTPDGDIQYAEFAMLAEDWSAARERWAQVRERFPELPAGYRRAAVAEEALGHHREARRLRLAEEHGANWLEDNWNTAAVAPPHRRDWRNFVDLVWTKARLNLKSEANRDRLRYLWWVIDPLLYMAVFYVVFALLLNRGGEGYVPYLLTGLIPFQWFAKTIQHTSNTIVQGRGLMNQVRISPLFFPLVAVVQNAGKQILVFVLLAILLVICGLPPSIHWLALIPVVIVQLLLMTALGCGLAMLVPFVRDLINLIPTGIQFVLFCSGIFYPIDVIPEQWRDLFMINPVANLLHQYRLILVQQQWPDWTETGWLALGCLSGLVAVIFIYRRLEGVFPRVVVE